MSPSPNIPKVIAIRFTDSATNDPVIITNHDTGEKITKDPHSGNPLRLEGRQKQIVFDCENFRLGWDVGHTISFSVGGTKAGTGSATITLTAATAAPQTATITTTAVSTAVLSL